MFVSGEGWLPSKESRALMERSAGEALPNPEDWPGSYYPDHKDRLAFDLDYAQRFLERAWSVLEVGALPYLLTVPLTQVGYRITAWRMADYFTRRRPEFKPFFSLVMRKG